MKIKKCILLLVLSYIALSSLPACSDNLKTTPKTEFTYWAINDICAQYHLNKVDEWNSLYPDRQIVLKTSVFQASQITEKLWTTLHSGILEYETPDLVDIEYHNYAKFVSKRNCLLYPLYDQESLKQHKQFSAYIYRELCFGIPYGMDKMVIYYNHELLKQANIDINQIKTWGDFIKSGEQYYHNTGLPFVSIDAAHYDFYITMLSQREIDYDNTAVGLKSTKSIETIGYMQQMVNQGIAILMPGGRTESNLFITAFNSGQIPVFIDQLANACKLSHQLTNMDGKVGIAEIPQIKIGDAIEVWIPSYATAITMSCENYSLLKDFLEYARLTTEASEDMLLQTCTGLYLDNQRMTAILKDSDFTKFYVNDISSLYMNNTNQQEYLPNITTVNEWIENYEYEYVKNIF